MVSCIRSETVKMLEEHFEEKLLDINLGKEFFESNQKSNKNKNKSVGLAQIKRLLHLKGNRQ